MTVAMASVAMVTLLTLPEESYGIGGQVAASTLFAIMLAAAGIAVLARLIARPLIAALLGGVGGAIVGVRLGTAHGTLIGLPAAAIAVVLAPRSVTWPIRRIRLPRLRPLRLTLRGMMVFVAVAGVLCFLGFKVWLICVNWQPAGISSKSTTAYVLASSDGPILYSPDRHQAIRVVFNDAGAAHSGLFWTWLMTVDAWGRKRVVAEGYSAGDVRYQREAFPAKWLDERTLQVEFFTSRRGGNVKSQIVRLE